MAQAKWKWTASKGLSLLKEQCVHLDAHTLCTCRFAALILFPKSKGLLKKISSWIVFCVYPWPGLKKFYFLCVCGVGVNAEKTLWMLINGLVLHRCSSSNYRLLDDIFLYVWSKSNWIIESLLPIFHSSCFPSKRHKSELWPCAAATGFLYTVDLCISSRRKGAGRQKILTWLFLGNCSYTISLFKINIKENIWYLGFLLPFESLLSA